VNTGVAEGRIVFCDLETLIFSFGTNFDPLMYGDTGNIILGIEELDIEMSTLQRQLDIVFNHKRINRVRGFICGRLVNIREASYPEWGKSYTPQKLVSERLAKRKIPMAFCEDIGHPEWDYGLFVGLKKYFHNRNFATIPNGIMCRLTVEEKNCNIEFLEEICGKS
jgi:muramoyltetrapeptide carboxypeptidase LdcA involved in peptidoglycan recycling